MRRRLELPADAAGRLDRALADALGLGRAAVKRAFALGEVRAAGRRARASDPATPGLEIEIEVEDNGRGIAATDHERVFELFRRSGAQSQPGEGIGLAHVRTMVRSLGGDITLRSELGQGTTFIITLPRDLRSYLETVSK